MVSRVDTLWAIDASFARGDVPAILTRLAPDVAWEHDRGGEPLRWFSPRRGRKALTGFFGELAAFAFRGVEPFAFLAGGAMVAVPIRLGLVVEATGPADPRPGRQPAGRAGDRRLRCSAACRMDRRRRLLHHPIAWRECAGG